MKIQLIGQSGRMGTTLCELINEDPHLTEVEEGGDVVIDFSSPEGTKKAIALGKPLVCGTTGLPEETFAQLNNLSSKVPVLYSPNFSLGIALLIETLEKTGTQLKNFSTPKLEEIHHIHKKDAPSGTALKLGELLEIPPSEIESQREAEVVGIHQIDFIFGEETLTFRHEAHSRKAFALGAIAGAKFLFGKPPGFYTLRDLFNESSSDDTP